jgi:biopolymer transport protein ExbB
MNPILEQMLHTWTNGGWVMAALAMLALITYASAAHLLIYLYHRGLTKVTDAHLRCWVARPSDAPGNLRELIRYTQDEVHSLEDIEGRFREVEAAKVPEVDRRLAFLNVMVVAAPLFGLLGTVLGMLLTFKAIGVGGSSTSEIIAKGISEALVATQTGMMVAIPGLLMAFVAKRWRNEYVAFLARLEGITLRHFRPEFHGMTRHFLAAKAKTPAETVPVKPPSAVAEAKAATAFPETVQA